VRSRYHSCHGKAKTPSLCINVVDLYVVINSLKSLSDAIAKQDEVHSAQLSGLKIVFAHVKSTKVLKSSCKCPSFCLVLGEFGYFDILF